MIDLLYYTGIGLLFIVSLIVVPAVTSWFLLSLASFLLGMEHPGPLFKHFAGYVWIGSIFYGVLALLYFFGRLVSLGFN